MKAFIIAIALLLALAIAGCDDDPSSYQQPVKPPAPTVSPADQAIIKAHNDFAATIEAGNAAQEQRNQEWKASQ